MLTSNINNQNSFNGRLFKGGYLSKNFSKSEKELSEMIKDKPYDVYAKGGALYKKRGHIHRTTFFNAQNYCYLPSHNYGLISASTYTHKTKAGSYKSAMQNLVDEMDAKVAQAQAQKPKKASPAKRLKNFIFKKINEGVFNEWGS